MEKVGGGGGGGKKEKNFIGGWYSIEIGECYTGKREKGTLGREKRYTGKREKGTLGREKKVHWEERMYTGKREKVHWEERKRYTGKREKCRIVEVSRARKPRVVGMLTLYIAICGAERVGDKEIL